MRRNLVLALVLGLSLGIAGMANAATIDITLDLNTQALNGYYQNLSGTGSRGWSFDLSPYNFSIPPANVTTAWVKIWGTGHGLGSNDNVLIESTFKLGNLGGTFGTMIDGTYYPELFSLNDYFYGLAGLGGAGWPVTNTTFDVTLAYKQNGSEIDINSSQLYIVYDNGNGSTQVPEPGMLMLLGSGFTGLIGLVGYRRMRRMQ